MGFDLKTSKSITVLKTAVFFVILPLFCVSANTPAFSQSDTPQASLPPGKRTLIVGIDPIPPFALRTEEGQWHGISWAIWHLAAAELGWKYKIKPIDLEEIIPALLSGEIDVAATGYGITSLREAKLDFTVPYYFAAFGVLVYSSN